MVIYRDLSSFTDFLIKRGVKCGVKSGVNKGFSGVAYNIAWCKSKDAGGYSCITHFYEWDIILIYKSLYLTWDSTKSSGKILLPNRVKKSSLKFLIRNSVIYPFSP